MNTLNTAQGTFTLARYPLRKKETLRAWDAADEYLLQHIDELLKTAAEDSTRILIINDGFGALTVALHTLKADVQTDSYLAHQSILKNLDTNNLQRDTITLLNSMEMFSGIYDLVIIKIPKSNAYLEDLLCKIQPHINAQTKIICGAMAKNIHTNTLKVFEKVIGETTTSLAKKKARLVFSRFTNNKVTETKYPDSFELALDDKTLSISNHSNVFSREKLDIGTRFLLENFPPAKDYQTIVDLGCGNGILGLVAAHQQPKAQTIFVDESYMAVASAKQNFAATFGATKQADFIVSDCLNDVPPDSVDLILCNPPFHQDNVVGDHIAWQMFNDAYSRLKQDGEFWIVGNHHLAYHAKLKIIFGGYTVAASNKKFAIMFSRKK